MKKLEKIKLSKATKVLTEQEMKLVTGGTTFYCVRLEKDGNGWGTFTTDSPELVTAWADVWYAFGNWDVSCSTYSPLPYIYC